MTVLYIICFPGTTTNSDQYDVTLLICLLRNIAEPPIIKPVTGFDKLPQSHDTSEGADLARMKYYRNDIAHSADAGTSNDDFNNAWDNLSRHIDQNLWWCLENKRYNQLNKIDKQK
jgi:hypothetical protein